MISRVWTGWTTPDRADAYERAVTEVVLPRMAALFSSGYYGADVLRRNTEAGEVEFMTVLWFESEEVVRRVTGEDVLTAHVPKESAENLTRWEQRVRHFGVVQRRDG